MRWIPCRTCLALLPLLGVVASADGQSVHGLLVERLSGRPVPGAFVVLVDSTGAAVSTSLTGPAGTWLVRAPREGLYRLRADRIGYISTLTDPIRLAPDQVTSYRMEVGVAPVLLAELDIQASGRCEALRDESLAIQTVWEEARKALSAIVWTGQQPYFRFDVVLFRRGLDPAGVPAGDPEYEEARYFGRHPFRSIPVPDLLYGGFVQFRSQAVNYYGPDADVLLSDAFLRRHCFRLVEPETEATVGLRFEPVESSRIVDISGTMWLDASSAELDSLEFRYENLDLAVSTRELGGRIEFAQLPSGAWIVRRWSIRTPIIHRGPPRRDAFGRPLPPRPTLAAIDEGGGQVTAVFLTSRLVGHPSTDTLAVRPPPDSLIVRFPLQEP